MALLEVQIVCYVLVDFSTMQLLYLSVMLVLLVNILLQAHLHVPAVYLVHSTLDQLNQAVNYVYQVDSLFLVHKELQSVLLV
jgi:hypothetical protein